MLTPRLHNVDAIDAIDAVIVDIQGSYIDFLAHKRRVLCLDNVLDHDLVITGHRPMPSKYESWWRREEECYIDANEDQLRRRRQQFDDDMRRFGSIGTRLSLAPAIVAVLHAASILPDHGRVVSSPDLGSVWQPPSLS